MKKTYNQSKSQEERKTRFDPFFWEVHFDQESLARLSAESALHYESADDRQARLRQDRLVARLMPVIRQYMAQHLTVRQCKIVELYFFQGKTETEIADLMRISAATVSQHLFGKRRNGKLVGGAIPKLRKKLVAAGICFPDG